MHFSAGPSSNSWQPAVTADSTNLYYWLNWRVLLCAVWVLSSMIIASILIWKFEGSNIERTNITTPSSDSHSPLYQAQLWMPCLTEIHPAWLLVFRLAAFSILLAFLIINVVVDGGGIFYYYTQWTFMLVTIYFLFGSVLSIYGCHKYFNEATGDDIGVPRSDTELGTYTAPVSAENTNVNHGMKQPDVLKELYTKKPAGFWGNLFQIIFQTSAGAVILTDCVFWLIIFPFLAIRDYNLNFVLIGMHTVNAIFLLGDTALNSLSFPWFRIAYFLLWTAIYVLFQWIIHACVSIWWPYPFLDLSSTYAPLWYSVVALMHVPCYAAFLLITKMKHFLLSRWFPESYSSTKQQAS